MGNIRKIGFSKVGIIQNQKQNNLLYTNKAKAAVSGLSSACKKTSTYNNSSGAMAVKDLKRMAKCANKSDLTGASKSQNTSSLFSGNYAQSLQETRANKKKSNLALKRLQYNFKKVSTEIIRSKTSLAAKSAARKARSEVLRLKRQMRSGNYDTEEIQAAIVHAKAMERVAKKKAAHLQQEEMIEVTDDGSETMSLKDAFKIEEGQMKRLSDEEQSDLSSEDMAKLSAEDMAEFSPEQMSDSADIMPEQMSDMAELALEDMSEISEIMTEQMAVQMSEQMSEMMYEMMDVLQEQMAEMMEQFDLMEMLSAPVGKMNEEDFKMLKTKHRGDEMKEIAKADKEYLKVIFKKMSDTGKASASPVSGSQNTSPDSGISNLGISNSGIPDTGFSDPGVSIDISL
ncbi:MAG: DUF4175 domain-containing protein [Lachnospiraceae bacterium]|nr:DUF4175 domain-containing protein [Lachnospiraceae bacterium]